MNKKSESGPCPQVQARSPNLLAVAPCDDPLTRTGLSCILIRVTLIHMALICMILIHMNLICRIGIAKLETPQNCSVASLNCPPLKGVNSRSGKGTQ